MFTLSNCPRCRMNLDINTCLWLLIVLLVGCFLRLRRRNQPTRLGVFSRTLSNMYLSKSPRSLPTTVGHSPIALAPAVNVNRQANIPFTGLASNIMSSIVSSGRADLRPMVWRALQRSHRKRSSSRQDSTLPGNCVIRFIGVAASTLIILPQRMLGVFGTVEALKNWQKKYLHLLNKVVYKQPGLDNAYLPTHRYRRALHSGFCSDDQDMTGYHQRNRSLYSVPWSPGRFETFRCVDCLRDCSQNGNGCWDSNR